MFSVLLDTTEKQINQFLTYCYEENRTIFSIKELMAVFNYKPSKILTVIHQVELFQEQYSEFSLTYPFESKSIKIEFSQRFLISKVHAVLLTKSIGFTLLDSFFKGKYQSLEQLSQETYRSLRTIQRKLSELNNVLANYHLSYSLKKANPLEGKEYYIRYFYHVMYWQVFDEMDSELLSMVRGKESLVTQFQCHAPYMRKIDSDKFLCLLAISFQRIKQQHPILEIPAEIKTFQHPLISKKEFTEYFLVPFFQANIYSVQGLPEEEISFLYFMFAVMNTYLEDDLIKIPREWLDQGHLAEETIILKLGEYFDLSFTDAEKNYLLVNLAMIHAYSLVFGTVHKIDGFGKQTKENELQGYFPVMYPTMKRFLLALKTEIPELLNFIKKNDRLIFQYCMLARTVFIKYEQPVTFSIQSKFGKTQELWIKNRLLHTTHRAIEHIPMVEKPDILISDYPIHLEVDQQIKVFYWNGQPTGNDWERLEDIIYAIRSEKHKRVFERLSFTTAINS
ncbi:helix-turn-helix domain-containing protein [Enterococcus sp.]|uniref:helix-turn-helix domain-containing protein n=1 Tax=Enterococcus sp. TaxID=35783 RepID=UPI0025C4AFCE|nr:helix-turn-helix domain-containing protein [Enterococcus sp.]